MLFAGLALLTGDVVSLSHFYRRVLRVSSDDPNNAYHQRLSVPGAELAIMAREDGDGTRGAAFLMFTVDDVDAEYSRLTTLCVPVDEPPTNRPWGARNLYFKDPDGNRISFRSFPPQ